MRRSGSALTPSVKQVVGVVVIIVAAAAAFAAAAPGDAATGQDKYKALKAGADHLVRANEALEKGDDKFKGHRAAAVALVHEALAELDEAVKYADKHDDAGERIEPRFEPDRAKVAASQSKYLAIRGGANRIIEAGTVLDKGFDKFGGHRVKAIKLLNSALDELEKAVKEAD